MKEKIIKLLNSPVREDVLLGLHLMKDWKWQDLKQLELDQTSDSSYKFISNPIGDTDTDNFVYSDFYCHFNRRIHFYKGDPWEFHSHVNYTIL